jgi:hypothetical protein
MSGPACPVRVAGYPVTGKTPPLPIEFGGSGVTLLHRGAVRASGGPATQ